MNDGNNASRGTSGSMAASILLVAMACLCLAVFAMLGMSSAMAHKRISDAGIVELEGYYQAAYDAEQDFAAALEFGESGTYSGRYHISDAQSLEVEYVIYENRRGEIIRWTPVPAGEWAEEEIIEVIH